MGLMRSRSKRAERLLVAVETAHGSGSFAVDARLLVEEIRQRSDDAVSAARIAVRLSDDFDSEEARRWYHPDRRLIVMTEHPDPVQRELLFEGYPPVQWSRWDGRVNRAGEEYVFEAEHVLERLARDSAAWVYGRRVRSGAIEDGLASAPADYAGESVLTTALPCVFNPDGEANCDVLPLTVVSPAGQPREVPLFATRSTEAAAWTFAAVLRYLVWFHLTKRGPVQEGNVFEVTQAAATGGDALSQALMRRPVLLSCEAVNLVEALGLACEAAGIHFTADTVNVQGRPATQLRLWASQAGAVRVLHLARGGIFADGQPRYDSSTKSVEEVLEDNNTYRGKVQWDHGRIVNRAVVLGDVKRYELTLPLVPGWLPTANLDNVAPASRKYSKGLALTPDTVKALGDRAATHPWYMRYHRDGSLFAQYANVARLWVLNEDGSYAAASYNRNAPFDDYRPFDFSTVLDASEAQPGAWSRRVRPLMSTISVGANGQSLGVVVEVSFNSGASWYTPSGRVRVLKDRAGIYFDCDNPTEITPPEVEPEVQNLWYAIIDQAFRVRVTAVIEGDERLQAVFGPAGLDSPTVQVNTRVVRRPKSFGFASRSSGTNVLYPAMAGGEDERDDTDEIEQFAEWLAGVYQDRQVQVLPVIPWVETGYGIGDQIAEVRGRLLRLATRVGAEQQYPAVVERRFYLQDGRYETELKLEAAEMPEPAL